MNSAPFDVSAMPCGSNCLDGCPIRSKMVDLQRKLVSATTDRVTGVVRIFLATYDDLVRESAEGRRLYPATIALPALFDLVLSARYAARAIANDGWTYCAGADFADGPAQYFAFLKACPRCSVRRPVPPTAKSNKPGSDTIGSIASDLTTLILAEYLSRVAPELRVVKSSERQGDIDAVIYGEQLVALAEIKSSPLVVYPLEVRLAAPMTTSREGEAVPLDDHVVVTADLTHDIAFFLPHHDVRIPLGPFTPGGNWPYAALERYLQQRGNLTTVLAAWKDLYQLYRAGYRRPRQMQADADRWRWLICGCGGGIDEVKNAPGLDRSDDMKKGTYQVLKFGTYYKEQCAKRLIRAILASNVFPLHLYAAYLGEMHDIIWSKNKYVFPPISAQSTTTDVMSFQKSDVFHLYDALLCFTESRYRDENLRAIFTRVSGE